MQKFFLSGQIGIIEAVPGIRDMSTPKKKNFREIVKATVFYGDSGKLKSLSSVGIGTCKISPATAVAGIVKLNSFSWFGP